MKLNLTNCEIGTITTTKDKGLKIVLYTPELSAVDMVLLFEAQKKGIADEIDVDYTQEGKTPSERLRNVLYAVFKDQKVVWIFDDYYRAEMEKVINVYKAKLPPM
jgi:hypothetical protein